MKTPGGGGYGSPFDRDELLVLKDVKEQKYTVDDVSKSFGVFIDEKTLKIDNLKTKTLRQNKKII